MSASRELISKITDVVATRSRPVDDVYPISYVDAIRIKVKDRGVVATREVTDRGSPTEPSKIGIAGRMIAPRCTLRWVLEEAPIAWPDYGAPE